jgi:hypothetical protein
MFIIHYYRLGLFHQIQWDYLPASPPRTDKGLEQAGLGAEFAQVQFRLSGNMYDPDYRSQNGDAAFLEPGTSVFTINGYQPAFRLAVPQNGEILLFEADTNPKARAGRDLLDIAGKVRYIGINSDRTACPNWRRFMSHDLLPG